MYGIVPDDRVPRKEKIILDGHSYSITDWVPGGSSFIYFTKSDRDKRRYVIKEMYPKHIAYREKGNERVCVESSYSDVFAEYKKRFKREYELINEAHYKTYQVVTFFERFFEDENVVLMAEVPQNVKDLEHLIAYFNEEDISVMDRIRISISVIRDLLCALKVLHRVMVHFDLSLRNVFFANNNGHYRSFLLDFGNARTCDENGCVYVSDDLDTPSSTPEFGAPELSRKCSILKNTTDLYSAALLFYHLICSGMDPYSTTRIPSAFVLSVSKCAEIKYGIQCLDIPVGLKRAMILFFQKAANITEKYRFQSADEMIRELDILQEIANSNGVHREVLLQSSIDKLERDQSIKKYIPELFPEMDLNVSRLTLITGAGGAGKSSFLKRLWSHALQKASQSNISPIPLYVQLQHFDADRDNKDQYILAQILDEYVGNWYAEKNCNFEFFRSVFQPFLTIYFRNPNFSFRYLHP